MLWEALRLADVVRDAQKREYVMLAIEEGPGTLLEGGKERCCKGLSQAILSLSVIIGFISISKLILCVRTKRLTAVNT